ncbi:uncharacterized protein AMSG_10857 [Thecamonas trahens ATCC 50062]|uniref:Ras-GEF domain-containing protein n=1 Tax=Thecamonas trahens ATCC 50062 TaxID=461836 RepID=A0A0L0DUQ5_THETB|nr:hypothetical protein AMSG_10857 [Thecamonas trahens ATCC 50062]KNC55228.1 hypothetical protein AMSG_10857 [Thecamonas trahens ATCC 50062]|eukprot:XP_013753158.1 hypothetical protein AMSG_10857 [Thecamonas trahens ATCC 50062]
MIITMHHRTDEYGGGYSAYGVWDSFVTPTRRQEHRAVGWGGRHSPFAGLDLRPHPRSEAPSRVVARDRARFSHSRGRSEHVDDEPRFPFSRGSLFEAASQGRLGPRPVSPAHNDNDLDDITIGSSLPSSPFARSPREGSPRRQGRHESGASSSGGDNDDDETSGCAALMRARARPATVQAGYASRRAQWREPSDSRSGGGSGRSEGGSESDGIPLVWRRSEGGDMAVVALDTDDVRGGGSRPGSAAATPRPGTSAAAAGDGTSRASTAAEAGSARASPSSGGLRRMASHRSIVLGASWRRVVDQALAMAAESDDASGVLVPLVTGWRGRMDKGVTSLVLSPVFVAALTLALLLSVVVDDILMAAALPLSPHQAALGVLAGLVHLVAAGLLAGQILVSARVGKARYLRSVVFATELASLVSFVFPIISLGAGQPAEWLLFGRLEPNARMAAWQACHGVVIATRCLGFGRAMVWVGMAAATRFRGSVHGVARFAHVSVYGVLGAAVATWVCVAVLVAAPPLAPHLHAAMYSVEAATNATTLHPLTPPAWVAPFVAAYGGGSGDPELVALKVLGQRMRIASSGATTKFQPMYVVHAMTASGTHAVLDVSAHAATVGGLALVRTLCLVAVLFASAVGVSTAVTHQLGLWIARTLVLVGSLCDSVSSESGRHVGVGDGGGDASAREAKNGGHAVSFAQQMDVSLASLAPEPVNRSGSEAVMRTRYLELRVAQLERNVLEALPEIEVEVSQMSTSSSSSYDSYSSEYGARWAAALGRRSSSCSVAGWEELSRGTSSDSSATISSLGLTPSWSTTASSDSEQAIYREQVRGMRARKKKQLARQALARKRKRRRRRAAARVRRIQEHAVLGGGSYEAVHIEFDAVERLFRTRIDGRFGYEGGILVAAPVYGLLEKLMHPPSWEARFQTMIVVTHVMFMSSRDLLEALVLRFCAPHPKALVRRVEGRSETTTSWSADDEREFEVQVARPVRELIVSVVAEWAARRPGDFGQASVTRRMLDEFVGRLCPAVGLSSGSKTVLEALGKAASIAHARPSPGSAPVPRLVGGPMSLVTVDATEVARQLTLVESHLYRRVTAEQLVGLGWTKADKDRRSPDVMRVFDHFNRVGAWVQASILEPVRASGRAERVEKFIAIARELRELNNLNGVLEIYGGLTSHAVKRLSHTWKKVSPEALAELESMRELGSAKASHKAYREALARCGGQACVPFLGVFLRDLVLVHEGNETMVDGNAESGGMVQVNVRKCAMTSETVLSILGWQEYLYPFVAVPEVRRLWEDSTLMTEDELFALSLCVEPRLS